MLDDVLRGFFSDEVFSFITALAATLGAYFLSASLRSLGSRGERSEQRAKETLFGVIDKSLDSDELLNLEFLRTIKASVERKYGIPISTAEVLEDYLVRSGALPDGNDGDPGNRELREVYVRIRPIIDSETEEKPFEKLPEDERRLMTALKASIEHDDRIGTQFNISELCSVIATRHQAYERERALNRWSVPLAIFGLLFTLIFGVLGTVGGSRLSESDLVQIRDAVAEAPKQSRPVSPATASPDQQARGED